MESFGGVGVEKESAPVSKRMFENFLHFSINIRISVFLFELISTTPVASPFVSLCMDVVQQKFLCECRIRAWC